jgi:hypothetical protein
LVEVNNLLMVFGSLGGGYPRRARNIPNRNHNCRFSIALQPAENLFVVGLNSALGVESWIRSLAVLQEHDLSANIWALVFVGLERKLLERSRQSCLTCLALV